MNFFYLPLLWVGFYWWRTPKDLGRFWTFCLGVGAIVAFLGIVQGIVGFSNNGEEVICIAIKT
jgi:hypothetical protein